MMIAASGLRIISATHAGEVRHPVASLLIRVVASDLIVSRKTLQIAVLACLVGLALAYPAIEGLDHWDAPGPVSDSELGFIAVFTFAGAIFLLTQVVPVLASSLFTRALPGLRGHTSPKKHSLAFSTHLTASPPVPLRI